MWLIIGTISFAVTYQTLYSLILYKWSDKEYCYIQENNYARAASTVTARAI